MGLVVYCSECDAYVRPEELVEGKCPWCGKSLEDEGPPRERLDETSSY